MAASESRRKGIRLVIILCVVAALAVTGILIWTSRRAKVKFYSEVASDDLSSISVSIGGTIEQPKDPQANDPGYSFGGWYSDPSYITEFDFDLPINNDTTIYVKWVERSFTVTILRTTNTGLFDEILWSGTGKYKSTIALPGENTYMNHSWMSPDDLRQYPFKRANQDFLGFSTTANAAGDFSYTYTPESNFTIPNTSVQLYAVFRGDKTSFVFNPNEGEGEEKTEDGYFNEIFTVPTSEGLSKRYYTFDYWCTDADGIPRDSHGNENPVDPSTVVNIYLPGQQFAVKSTETLTLYAIWKRNTINVTIDMQGGTNAVNEDVDAGLEGGFDLGTIATPIRDGYRLMSYNSLPDGTGVQYALDAVIPVEEEDIKIYAIWQRLLTIGYTLNNSKVSDDLLYAPALNGAYDDFTGIEGESIQIKTIPNTVVVPNFEFLGWSLDPAASGADYHQDDTFVLKESDFGENEKLYLYGVWQGDARVLRLYNTSDRQAQEINSFFGRLERITNTPVNVDSNIHFVGWGTVETYNYKAPDSYTGTIYEVGDLFEMGTNTQPGQTNDILYSLWCPNSYLVTYYLQGGELTAYPGQDVYETNYVYKETVNLLYRATRSGYRFMGWSLSANSTECTYYNNGAGTGYTIEMPGNGFQLYAVWEKEYTINFYNNAPDSAGIIAPINNVIIGETFTIPSQVNSNKIKRDNYSVVSWGSKADGGTIYEFDTVVTLESSDMVNFYAVWEGDARNVDIYNGGTKVLTLEGKYGQDIPLAFEDEIPGADPGKEIGGFYVMFKTSPTEPEKRQEFNYGDNIRTTSIYFQDENGEQLTTIDMYIVWANKYFSVVYELSGGVYNNDDNDDMSSYSKYEQYTNTIQLEPGTPTKNRYEFKGWTEDPDAEGAALVLYAPGADFTIPSHDVTLYAYWARIYSINFSSNGGELDPNEDETTLRAGSYSKGTLFIIPNNVYVRSNYAFKSWNTRADGQGDNYSIGSTLTVTSDVTLYAIWQGEKVDITLISTDPGNPAYSQQEPLIQTIIRFGDTISLSSFGANIKSPTNGLVLKGWKLDDQPNDLDVEVDIINDYTVDRVGAIQIYAVWSPRNYFFSVSLNGGIADNSYNDKTDQYPYRTQINLATYSDRITREGYRLMGYADVASATTPSYALDAVISMPDAAKKIYCVWKELAIITFDANYDGAPLQKYVFEGIPEDVTANLVVFRDVVSQFSRENYTLAGWSTSSISKTPDNGFNLEHNESYSINSTADIYLYCVWVGRKITVTFDANGGSGAPEVKDYRYGDVIDLNTDAFKRLHSDPGYDFSGWGKESGDNNSNSTVGSSFTVATTNPTDISITLYAIWTKKFFEVTYDYGDSSLGSKPTPDGFDRRQVQYTTQVDVTPYVGYARLRLGYLFKGWAEDVNESDPTRIYGAPDPSNKDNSLNNTFPMPNGAIKLYAIWEPIYVEIIYKNDDVNFPGATFSDGRSSYTTQELFQLSFALPGSRLASGVTISKASYKFAGWLLQGDSSGEVRKEGQNFQVNKQDAYTFLAQWTENVITVQVNANGGVIKATNTGTANYPVRENGEFTLPTEAEISRPNFRLAYYVINGNRYFIADTPTVTINNSLIAPEDIDANTVKITAQWVEQMTIEFRVNATVGEAITGSIENIVLDYGLAFTFPNCSATEGYQRPYHKFIKWNLYADGSGTSYNAGASLPAYASTTYYAIWEGNDRTLTLHFNTNQNGHLTGETATTEKFYSGLKYGDQLDFSDNKYTGECVVNGYMLGGWTDREYDSSNPGAFVAKYAYGSIFTVKNPDSTPDIHLYAVWTQRSYQVTYNANGGVFADGSDVKSGVPEKFGEEFILDTTFIPAKPGGGINYYSFAGWSISSSFSWGNKNNRPTTLAEPSASYCYYPGTAYVSFNMPSNDVVLYAVWEPVSITVQYYYEMDDFVAGSSPNVIDETNPRYGDTVTLLHESVTDPNQQIKVDHSFAKWQHMDLDKTTLIREYNAGTIIKLSQENMSEAERAASTKVMVFVATWIPQTVFIQIDANEGAFLDESTTRVFESSVGRTFTLPTVKDEDNRVVRENFALKTFNKNSNGTDPVWNYNPGGSFKVPSLKELGEDSKENIEIDGEMVETYVIRLYAIWVEAEAYIMLSDIPTENPYYETLGEAIADCSNQGTVIIIKDCFIKSEITLNKQVSIDATGNWSINRYVDEDDDTKTYKGYMFNIGTQGVLIVGTDAAESPEFTITFSGGSDIDDVECKSMFMVAGSLRLYNGVEVINTEADNGGAIYANGNNASIIIHYADFTKNVVSGNGGAIYIAQAGNVEIKTSIFEQNTAGNYGGAIYATGIVLLEGNTFNRNQAKAASAGGGAVYNNNGTITDTNNTYDNNSTTGKGGAINNKGTYNISGTIFILNKAVSAGGAIFNDKTSGNVNNMSISKAVFGNFSDDTQGNSSNNYGGAITNNGRMNISGTAFYNNHATYGGAISNEGTTSVLVIYSAGADTAIFTGNYSNNGSGGAIIIQSALTFNLGENGVTSSKVEFNGNTVGDGKGHSLAITGSGISNIYTASFTGLLYEDTAGDGGIIYQTQGTLNIYSAEIYGNTITNGYGGGLYIAGGTCNAEGLYINNNVAKYGGAIAVAGSGKVTLTNAEIYSNTAVFGGAIYVKDSGAQITLTSNGSGGYAKIGASELGNSAISVDSLIASGGAICTAGKVVVDGAVVAYNTSEGNGGGFYVLAGGVIELKSGTINDNSCLFSGGAGYCESNGSVKFTATSSTRMLIENNLCADGEYMLGDYDGSSGDYYANGIFITDTKVILSGYMVIGLNSTGTILNDIYLSQRVGGVDKPTKILEYSNTDSAAELASNARICVGSKAAIMGDKLVKFPSVNMAKNHLAKFSYAGDDSGFRVQNEYLILGNYAAIIERAEGEVYYSSLVEAYIDAGFLADGTTPETIILFKNIKLSEDLAVYEENDEAAEKQEQLLDAAGVTGVSITDSFYIAKKVIITAGAGYTISRGDLDGDMFTIVGNGQLTLGQKEPTAGSMLTVQGEKDILTGSIIKVEANTSGENQFILYNGATLSRNKADRGGAVYNLGMTLLKGGEISNNIATAENGEGWGGAVYSEGYLELVAEYFNTTKTYVGPLITKNKAHKGGGIYINNTDTTANALFINSLYAVISKNEATDAGGGIFIYDGKVQIKACDIKENKAAVDNGVDGRGGGGIYVYGGSENTLLNIASEHYNWISETDAIQIRENESETNGGGIVVDNATFTFQNGYIQENIANGKGGGIALVNTTSNETKTIFSTDNTAYCNWIFKNRASNGGGIAVIKGTAVLKAIKVMLNEAISNGGGVYNEDKLELYNNSRIGAQYSVNSTTLNGGNISAGDGGGIYNTRSGYINFVTSTAYVEYNQAAGYGGGIANAGTINMDKYGLIQSNRASVGGGVANLDSNAMFIFGQGQIRANTATSTELGGGGLYNAGTFQSLLEVGSTNIGGDDPNSANKAFNGGGIYNTGKLITKRTKTPTTHHALYIKYNEAQIYGGGIYNTGEISVYYDYITYSSYRYIDSIRLQYNKTTTDGLGGGAGICNNGGIINSIVDGSMSSDYDNFDDMRPIQILNNQTGGYGGGLLVLDGTVNIVTWYIEYNTASVAGGGVAVIAGDVSFGIKDRYKNTYGPRFQYNSSSLGNDLYMQVPVTFNTWFRAYGEREEIYLANPRAYLIFNTRQDTTNQSDASYYAQALNVYVNAMADGRRVAKFSYYTTQENFGESELVEVTNYYADKYYQNMTLMNSIEGWGLTVDANGYVVVSEPVCELTNAETGMIKKYSTIAAAVAAIPEYQQGFTSDTKVEDGGVTYFYKTMSNKVWDVKILKSHTVDQQVLISNKNVNFICQQNIILTVSKRLSGKPMFLIYTSFKNHDTQTVKYTVNFNPSDTNRTINGVSGQKIGAAAAATLTLDGNKSMYAINKYGNAAVLIRSGASTTNANGQTIPSGTGIYVTSNRAHQAPAIANVTFADCDVTNWKTPYYGAINAILFTDQTTTDANTSLSSILTVQDCSFEGNHSTLSASYADSYFQGPFYDGGSCLNIIGGVVRLDRSQFIDNYACRPGGAFIFRYQQWNAYTGEVDDDNSAVRIRECLFERNDSYYGGAGLFSAVQGKVLLDRTAFTNNTASYGGAIMYYNALPQYNFNDWYNGTWYTRYYSANTTYSDAAFLKILDTTTFTNNYISQWYDPVYPTSQVTTLYYGGAIWANSNLRDYGARYESNSAAAGGAIYMSCTNGQAYFENTTFTGNRAVSSSGGALYLNNIVVKKFYNIKADNNSAVTYGGAVWIRARGPVTVEGPQTSFISNSAANGGAIYTERDQTYAYASTSKVHMEILEGVFRENSADSYGGALYFHSNWTSGENDRTYKCFIWEGVSISDNKAGARGGGVYAHYMVVLYSVNVTDNQVTTATSDGGGAGVYAQDIDIIRCSITGNTIQDGSASGMAGAGVRANRYLSLGMGYSTYSSASSNHAEGRKTYYSPSEASMTSSKTISGTSTTLYRFVQSNTDQTAVSITNNLTVNGGATASGIYSGNKVYMERYMGDLDTIFLKSAIQLSNSSIWIRRIINIYYGGSIGNNTTVIKKWSYNDLIPSEITRFNIVNNGYTLKWVNVSDGANINLEQSILRVAVNANGWNSDTTFTSANRISDAKLASGRTEDTKQVAYNTLVKIMYNEIVPTRPGYSFHSLIYFKENDISTGTYYTLMTASDLGALLSSMVFNKATINKNVTATKDGGDLEAYVVWQAKEYTMTMKKMINGKDYFDSYQTGDSPTGSGNYTYNVETGEALSSYLTDFETAASSVSGAKAGWTKSYYKGYDLSYYMDWDTKKVYAKTEPYLYTRNTTMVAVYKRQEYTLTFNPGPDGTANHEPGANILKVKYQAGTTLLGDGVMVRSGHRIVGWTDNKGNPYALNTVYDDFSENLTFEPIWEAIPYDLRIYYNYPDGGTSFALYSINAGASVFTSVGTFAAAVPDGYTLKGFSTDAAGEYMVDNTMVMPGENTILYAQWQPKVVRFTFYDINNNPLTGSDYEIEAYYGSEIILPELPASSDIKLWENSGSGIYYSPGSSFLITSETARYLTFYAVNLTSS